LGLPAIDALLPGHSLKVGGLHELKPEFHGDWWASLAFACMLAVRRLDPLAMAPEPSSSVILWCWTAARAHELGRLYAPGLREFGLSPSSFLIAETGSETDVLWAVEEGLKSRAPVLVVGCLADVGLTPARRLSLAAEAYGIPCLLLTDPCASGAAAVTTRWRIGRATSGTHSLDPAAPGRLRLRFRLERARGMPILEDQSICAEWCSDTHRFNLAAGVVYRTDAAASAGRRAGGWSVRAG
jgi:protein ImuA